MAPFAMLQQVGSRLGRVFKKRRRSEGLRAAVAISEHEIAVALVRKIEPMVQAREAFLLGGLEPGERAVLDAAFDKVLARARQLLEQG